MALRMKHEGLQQLTMRGASEWSDGVIMAMRDCSPPASKTASEIPAADSAGSSSTICKINVDVAGQALQTMSSANAVILSTTANTDTAAAAASSSSCAYSSTCTAQMTEKNQIDEYGSHTSIASLISTASGGVRLVLNGQPMAIGGGVHMRIFSTVSTTTTGLSDNQGEGGGAQQMLKTYADFPTLVGNQWNEFTMEPHAPQGVPVVQTASVPSQQHATPNVRQTTIDMPPNYVQDSSIPYNPGTLSPEALWYATNPSYEWAYALAQYCMSKGKVVETQIMMLSSYAPMRLQRVRYQDSACFIASGSKDNEIVCASDLFTASILDASKAIPGISSDATKKTSQLYDLCASNTVFNLWIDTLEYFDASNIAVGVRQGTMADLGNMLTSTSSEQGTAGKTVYYFVRVDDVSQIRADIPWPTTTTTTSSTSTTISFENCPALRMLPNVGAVLGLSLQAVARLLGTIVNFILNPFAFPELIEARAAGACPENSLLHSALEDCGMALLSLDDFFHAIYAANTAIWDIMSWLVSVVLPPSLVQNQILSSPLGPSNTQTITTSTASKLSDFLKVFALFLFVLFCFVLFCFVLFCFVCSSSF